MKKLVYIGAVVAAGAFVSMPALATISGNHGSNVKISGSCQQIVDAVKNNHGSNIKVTGNGTCNIEEIAKSGAISGNHGSNVKIDGVCGTVPANVAGNHGSNIKITSNGACATTTKPTTTPPRVEVTNNHGSNVKVEVPAVKTEAPKKEQPKAGVKPTVTVEEAKPAPKVETTTAPVAELPETGAVSNVLPLAGALGAAAYGIGYAFLRRR